MFTIAEIADKMPGVFGLWLPMLALALPLIGLASINRYVALVVLAIAIMVSGFFVYGEYDEITNGIFAESIWRELGWPWVISAFAAACFPTVAVLSTCLIRWWIYPNHESGSEGAGACSHG